MNYTIGIDECGYGSLAGPLVVCAVRAPTDWSMDGLRDSKKLTKEKRTFLRDEILKSVDEVISYSISISTNDEIDNLGLAAAHKKCIADVVKGLYVKNDEIILDGNLSPRHFTKYGIDESYNFRSEIKGDNRFPTVMAASIIGKVYRDNLMATFYHLFHPEYGWDTNFGYSSPSHKEAIRNFGFSPVHRKSYNIKLT